MISHRTPPITAALLPVEVPGLVCLLGRFPDVPNNPDSLPLTLTQRVQTEVVDFLDARAQQDVAVEEVTEQWLGDFRQYLDTFYQPAMVVDFVSTVQKALIHQV